MALKVEEEANKKLHAASQKYTELVAKLVPLHEKVVEMTAAAEASKVHTSNLETRCTPQEVNLGKVEGELAAKNEAFNLLQAEFTKQTEALAVVQKELASQAERSQKVEKELLEDGAHAFAAGFEEALSQVACENPGVNVSNCAPTKEGVDGKIVPLEFFDNN